MSPRRNPDLDSLMPSVRARAAVTAPYFLRDGRAVFPGDPMPDDCDPGTELWRDGRPVATLGLDGRNRVVILQPEPGSMQWHRMQGATPTAAIHDEAAHSVDLPGLPEEALGPIVEGIAAATGNTSTAVHEALERAMCDCTGDAIHGHTSRCPARRRTTVPPPAEPGITVFDDARTIAASLPGVPTVTPPDHPDAPRLLASLANIQPIDPLPFHNISATIAAGMLPAMEAAGNAARSLASTMTDEQIRAAAIRRDTVPRAQLERAERDAAAARADNRHLRAELERLRAGADAEARVRTVEAVAAAKAWKETPVTDSVAKRDSFLRLLDTLDQLAR